MNIGIISDTHGSLTAWQKAYPLLSDSDLIVHCGDVLYHGPRNPLPEGYHPQELVAALNAVEIPMVFAKGNCDAEVDQLLLDHPLESPYAHIIMKDLKILVHHGHSFEAATIPTKITRNHQLIISGHTHLPGIERKGTTVFVNPGSPALPKNNPKIPTVARIRDREIQIMNLNDGTVLQSLSL